MFPSVLPQFVEIAIVGAGPQALTLATRLLQKRQKLRHRFMVFDGSGTWLNQWQHQFAAQAIPHLRSPAVHHPDPNSHALRRFAENRCQEFFAPYDLPGTKLFDDFCREVIRRYQLEEYVYAAKVIQILPLKTSRSRRFQLILSDGSSILARRVVLATGSSITQVPDWVKQISSSYPPDRLLHSQDVDLRSLHLKGEQILIVGGGLTSGHLAVGATALGAKVLLMARRELQEKLFDADPGWLGPKYLKGFFAETDWEKRWTMIQQARHGGSMTPAMMLQLRKAARESKISLQANCQVKEAAWQENQWQIVCEHGEVHQCSRIWLATGTQFNGRQHPLLKDVLEVYPTDFVKGLPILDDYLRLPKTEFFIMGGLAALQVGPTARNLSGGIKASDRIAEALVKPSLAVS